MLYLSLRYLLIDAVEPGKEVMSRLTTCTFTCPCGKVFNSPIYEYVNTAHDPQLQYTVLAGLLNVSRCPACGRRAVLSRPFIYSDPLHGLLAYVHPSEDVPEAGRELIRRRLEAVYTRGELYSAPATGGHKGPYPSQPHPRPYANYEEGGHKGSYADYEEDGHKGSYEDCEEGVQDDAHPTSYHLHPYADCEEDGQEDARPYASSGRFAFPSGFSHNASSESILLGDQQLHVVFGLEQLYPLINATLSQDERLGRLALSTRSRREAERGQLLDIARKFASVMQCQVDIEELPHAYTVWLYGSRRQIWAIMRELAP